jgi:GT2 family glycosyltransferase
MFKISAVVITYNEEKNIARCIDSLLSVADEIIVIDSWSTDATKSICEGRGVRFIQNTFIGYIQQKNFAVQFVSYDYILSIDADEYLSDELKTSILTEKQDGKFRAYTMNRLSSYKGQWIWHTDWYPDYKLRLWHREYGEWGGPSPHEKVVFRVQNKEIRHLKGNILHTAYGNSEDLLNKANQYSTLFAKSNKIKVGSGHLKIVYKSIFTFFRNYIIRRGFLSGLSGLQISFSNSVYTFFKYAKLHELNRTLPFFDDKMEQPPSGISVVIPNYNGINLFPNTLPPLVQVLKETNLPFEIIISDDCSTDSSVAYLNTNYPEIKVVKSTTNKGFSGACNAGIKEACFDLVFLLNSDIILTTGYFTHLFKYFQHENTFGVMGRIVGWDNDKIQDAARLPDFQGLKVKTSINYLLDPMQEESLYTFYLSGANALVNRKKLLTLGGLDELFSPFYIEDCDLSIRAWKLGWRCYYEHKAICRHRTSSTVKVNSKKKYVNIIYNRNKFFLHAIHLSDGMLVFWFLQLFVELILRSLTLRFSFATSVKLFLQQRKQWMHSRKKFKELMRKNGESIPLSRIEKGIKESLHNRKIIKFFSIQ